MFVVDTNILVYAADRHVPEHQICHAALQRWRSDSTPWYLTWSICFEFMRVVTQRGAFRTPSPLSDAWAFLRALFVSPALGLLVPGPQYPTVVSDITEGYPFIGGRDVFDMSIAALMREHGIQTIYTRDRGFHRFPFLNVIDPTAA